MRKNGLLKESCDNWLVVYSFDKYLLSAYYMLGTILGTGYAAMNKTERVSAFVELRVEPGEMSRKQTCRYNKWHDNKMGYRVREGVEFYFK